MVWDSNTRSFKGNYLSHKTFLKVQTQNSKDSLNFKKLKLKNPIATLSYGNMAELVKKKEDKKNKKKRFRD